MRPLLAYLLLLPVLAGLSLFSPSAQATTRSAATQRGPAPSDGQIEATIRTKLAKSKIGKDGFKFHVQRGVVTWEGATSVMQHKGSATRMAKTAGAVQVINNIQVSANGKSMSLAHLKKAEVSQ